MQYQNDLWIYEQVLREKLQRQYPLSEGDRQELQSLREVLKLKAEDIASLEHRVSSSFTSLPHPGSEHPPLPDLPGTAASASVAGQGFQGFPETNQQNDLSGFANAEELQGLRGAAASSDYVADDHVASTALPTDPVIDDMGAISDQPVYGMQSDFPQTMPPQVSDPPSMAPVPVGAGANPVYVEGYPHPVTSSSPAGMSVGGSTDGVEQLLRVLIQKMEAQEAAGLTSTAISNEEVLNREVETVKQSETELDAKEQDKHNAANAGALLPLLIGLACLAAIGAGAWFALPKTGSWFPLNLGGTGNGTDQNGVRWEQYLQWGLEKNKQGQYQAAIEDFSRAIQLNPQDTTSYVNRGVARHRTGDLNGALGDYDQAIRINPKIAEAHSNRSHVLYDLNDYNKAQQASNTAVSLNPNLAEAQLNLANALFALNPQNPATAIDHYNQGIRLNPKRANQAGAYNNRANARAVDDPRSAIADYDQAIQLDPNYADAYRNRGIAFQRLGNDRLAVRDLQDAAKLYLRQENQPMYQSTLDEIAKIQQRTPQTASPQPQATNNTVQFR